MRISRTISCTALVAMLVTAAAPAPAAAQIGGLIKRKLKEKVVQTVGGSDTAAPAAETADRDARTGLPRQGPRFTENVLEMTPELLDRFEKGLAAESAVRDEIDRALGKLLSPDDYHRCELAVARSPEGQKVYLGASDLLKEGATQEEMQKASEEIARRFDAIVRPKCGLNTRQADEVRTRHADRLDAAGPAAAGLTKLQLTLMKERIIPFCTAAGAPTVAAGEVRIPTSSAAISWVYSTAEMEALQPRCARLASALQRGA